MTFVPTLRFPALAAALAASILTAAAPARAGTEATLLVDAETGKVLHAENATMPWYPASTSKLMTVYVTLQAVKSQRITLDTLFTVSATRGLAAAVEDRLQARHHRSPSTTR